MEMDELIAHVFEKTYAYGDVRAENQNLLLTISELKTRLANVEKFHKTRFSKESTLSKSLDTTYIVSKPKIDVGSTSKANDKVKVKASQDTHILIFGTINDLTELDLDDVLPKFK
ncbi:hypothetical protein Tco_1146925 [Tanacetum coccineum]